jgi:hypothetical protein
LKKLVQKPWILDKNFCHSAYLLSPFGGFFSKIGSFFILAWQFPGAGDMSRLRN